MRVLASPALINLGLNPFNWLLNTHRERDGVEALGAAHHSLSGLARSRSCRDVKLA